VHLSSVGHPVVGDDTYGGGGGRKLVNLPPRRHFLHAAWLVFRHPVTGEPIDLRSPLPEDLHRALVVAAGPDVSIAQTNPLNFFGFYDVDP
jgi:23S rRNA pseudouridine1911/1915/1917 synthase